MDDRFDNLIRARDLRLGWILLALFCIVMLAVTRMSYWIVGFPSSMLLQHCSRVTVGILIALSCLISVWTTLGEGSLVRRTFFLTCTTSAVLATWALGLVASFYPESVRLSSREEIYFLGLLPTIFLALCLPLIIARWVFGLTLADQQHQSPPRPPTTTAGLMTVTALVGCCLGGIRFFTVGIREDGILIPIAIMSGCGFLVGLIAVLPSVLLLCSRRRSFMIWSLALMTLGCILIWGIIIGVFKITGAWLSNGDVWSILESTLAATVTFSIGIGIVRLFSYRLTKEVRNGIKNQQ